MHKLNLGSLCKVKPCSLLLVRNAGGKWRSDNNLPPRFAQGSVLTESPEWSYIDGRGFGPMNISQRSRYYRDAQWTDEVVKITNSMAMAKKLVPTNEKPELRFRERIPALDRTIP